MKKIRKPDAAAGNFAIAFGGIVLIFAMFSSANLGRKLAAASSALILLGWGIGQVTSAKKMARQESNDATKKDDQEATDVEYLPESESLEKLEKSGSMQNVFKLLVWVLLFVAVVFIVCVGYLFLFHHGQ